MVCINPSRLVMNSENFRNNFLSDLETINFSTSFHYKFFQASKAIKCFRRAKLVHEWLRSVLSLQTNSFCSKTLKIIEFFWALIKEFLSNIGSFWWIILSPRVQFCAIAYKLARSWTELLKLKKQPLERTTASYTSIAYISDIFLRPLFI